MQSLPEINDDNLITNIVQTANADINGNSSRRRKIINTPFIDAKSQVKIDMQHQPGNTVLVPEFMMRRLLLFLNAFDIYKLGTVSLK